MQLSELESKEFKIKFTFEKLMSTLMYLQKILELYPDKNCVAFKDCSNLFDNILDQLSNEERGAISNYLDAIHLDNTLEDS